MARRTAVRCGVLLFVLLSSLFAFGVTPSFTTAPASPKLGDLVTFSISVNGGNGASAASGTVSIFDNGVLIGQAVLTPNNTSTATFKTALLSVGTHANLTV